MPYGQAVLGPQNIHDRLTERRRRRQGGIGQPGSAAGRRTGKFDWSSLGKPRIHVQRGIIDCEAEVAHMGEIDGPCQRQREVKRQQAILVLDPIVHRRQRLWHPTGRAGEGEKIERLERGDTLLGHTVQLIAAQRAVVIEYTSSKVHAYRMPVMK